MLFQIFTNRKVSDKYFGIFCCIISFMFVMLTQLIIPNGLIWLKFLVMFAIDTLFCLLIIWIINKKNIQGVISNITHTTINSSIWRDVIDLEKGANVKIYFKNNDDYYLTGYLHTVDEINEKWICIAGFSKWNIVDDEHYMNTLGYKDDEHAKYMIEIEKIDHIEIFDGE